MHFQTVFLPNLPTGIGHAMLFIDPYKLKRVLATFTDNSSTKTDKIILGKLVYYI